VQVSRAIYVLSVALSVELQALSGLSDSNPKQLRSLAVVCSSCQGTQLNSKDKSNYKSNSVPVKGV